MKQLNLKTSQNIIKSEPYTFNSFNDDIRDFDKYIDYLNENLRKIDFTMVDKFVDYIYNIIDDTDYLFINELEESKEFDLYLNNLKHTYYDKIKLNNKYERLFYTKYLFDIKDKNSKQFLKDTITFNLSDEYLEPMIVKTDKKYILNDGSREYCDEETRPTSYCEFCFVKDDFLQLILFQRDGYIEDYRDIDELYFLKRKDLKVKNRNYISYDYTKFNKDINDDKYINYIYKIIDDVDYIFINHLSYKQECKYKDKLDYIYYDKILFEDKSRDFETNYVFDIKDSKSKQFIKDDIKFNLSDKDGNPILVDNNKKYILNEVKREEYEYMDYCFIKDDYLQVILHQKDGYIDEYRQKVNKKIK